MPAKLLLAACLLAPVASAAGTTASNKLGRVDEGLCVWVLLDTSPSAGSVAGELRTVAWAAVEALQPGDRLRVLSAHADRPRLRALERIGPDGPSETELDRVLDEVRPAIMLKADLAEALEVPLRALQDSAQSPQAALILVLTDGRLDDDQAARFLQAVDRLQSRGARVICTGTDQAARRLLVAAAAGRLRWGRLTEADPATWIADLRRRGSGTGSPQPTPEDFSDTSRRAPASSGDNPQGPEQPATADRGKDVSVQPPQRVIQGGSPDEKEAAMPVPPSQPLQLTELPPEHAESAPSTSVPDADAAPDAPLAPFAEDNSDGRKPPLAEALPWGMSTSATPQARETDVTPDGQDINGQAAATRPKRGAPQSEIPPPSDPYEPATTSAPGDDEAPPSRDPSPLAPSPAEEGNSEAPPPGFILGKAPGTNAADTIPAPDEMPAAASVAYASDKPPADQDATPDEQGAQAKTEPEATTVPAGSPSGRETSPATEPPASTPQDPPQAFGMSEPGENAPPPLETVSDRATPALPPPAETALPSAPAPREHRWPRVHIVVGGALGLLAIVWLAVLAADYLRSRPRKTDPVSTDDDDEEPDRRELAAWVNGREIALGPWLEVRRLEIGAGPRSAIPLSGEGIARRHATLSRNGDAFWLKNHARTPITANGVPLHHRRRARIVLPAELVFGEKIKVTLRVRERCPDEGAGNKGGNQR